MEHRIPTRDIHTLPELTPPEDPMFVDLLEQALKGKGAVYFAAVSMSRVRPFSPTFDVEQHPIGRAAVDDIVRRWVAGQFTNSWVYQSGEEFVLSDDYVVLAAARRGQPDYMPCWVLGRPTGEGVKDVQGPISVDDLQRLLGLA